MFRFKRPFFHFGSGCLLTDEAARLMLGSGTIWNVSGMHAVSRVSMILWEKCSESTLLSKRMSMDR